MQKMALSIAQSGGRNFIGGRRLLLCQVLDGSSRLCGSWSVAACTEEAWWSKASH